MAYVKIVSEGPLIRFYPDSQTGKKHRIGFNLSAWMLIGYPIVIDFLYDSSLKRIAFRNGKQNTCFRLEPECDRFPFHVFAVEVYETTGLDLTEVLDLIPQEFTWGPQEPHDPELESAVWVQLP